MGGIQDTENDALRENDYHQAPKERLVGWSFVAQRCDLPPQAQGSLARTPTSASQSTTSDKERCRVKRSALALLPLLDLPALEDLPLLLDLPWQSPALEDLLPPPLLDLLPPLLDFPILPSLSQREGSWEGSRLGTDVGNVLGIPVGLVEGSTDGLAVGARLGTVVGNALGASVGMDVGAAEGEVDGAKVGD